MPFQSLAQGGNQLQNEFHKLKQFQSTETGLRVTLVEQDGPLVCGYFVLGTEAHDDDGCPHTLEHLVFLGSDDWPFKGVLDCLANRALARGTNAWTDVDHTCYTITTAGSQGFLNLLPIYLDHILHPTMTETGYYTEIHHINGDGENAGVVYCEMQGRQNTSSDRIQLELQRRLFPGSGYRSETGGLMENLRELSAEKIREYHRQYYRADNLCLLITGRVDHEELLRILEAFDRKIIEKSTKRGGEKQHARPWVDSPPLQPFTESVQSVIEFPDEDELVGSVYVAWRGPKHQEHVELAALDILLTYLTDSAVALLQLGFVEMEDPFATEVSYHTLRYIETGHFLVFDGVPVEKLAAIQPRLMDILKKHLAEGDRGIDMTRMDLVIRRQKLKVMEALENEPSEFYVRPVIQDFLYGNRDGSTLRANLREIEYLDTLLTYSKKQWSALLRKYLVDRPFVCVQGKPSQQFAKQLQEHEAKRIEEQRKALGEAKLKELAKKLDDAKVANDQPIPDHILDQFPVPSLDGISRVPVVSAHYPATADKTSTPAAVALQKHVRAEKHPSIPLFIQFDQITSAFMEVNLFVNTSSIPDETRLYLELYLELFFTLPTVVDGQLYTHEEVVRALNRDTVSYGNSLGTDGAQNFFAGTFGQYMLISMKVERAKYETGIRWIHDLLWNSKMDQERIKIAATKLFNEIPDHKREGMKMCNDVLKSRLYGKQSNHVACSILGQEPFLDSLLKRLNDGKADKIIDELEFLRQQLLDPVKMMVQVSGDVMAVAEPLKPWSTFLKSAGTQPVIPDNRVIASSKDVSSKLGASPSAEVALLHMPAIESSFTAHVTLGPDSYDHPDIPALMVLNEYLTTMEGLFWKQVRGNGLAYGASLRFSAETGLITFVIYRSPDSFQAFKVVDTIIHELDQGKIDFEEKFIEAAKSSVVFGVIAREETASAAASESFMNQVFRKVGPNGNQTLLQNVSKVQKEDLRRVLNKYLRQLFDVSKSTGVVSTGSMKLDDITNGFKSLGYQVHVETMESAIDGDEE